MEKEIKDVNVPEAEMEQTETVDNQPQLDLVDIKNIHMIVQHAIDRGTFKSDELIQVIPVYQRLSEFVAQLDAQQAGE